MKVLLFNGSPRKEGCTHFALTKVEEILNEEGIETEILHSDRPVRDCIACGGCRSTGKCVFTDDCVNEWLEKASKADGFVFGSPVYYAHPSGGILSLLDRLFYAGGGNFAYKPSAVVVSARRAGTSASLDVLSKHLGINQMPVISSTYWNMIHGNTPKEAEEDKEGIQTLRNLGRNLAYFLKCVEAGRKAGIERPVAERSSVTNFIR